MRATEAPFETVNQELAEKVADVGGEIESAVIWAVCELNWSRARKGHQAGQAPISTGVLVRQPQPVIALVHTILRPHAPIQCPEHINWPSMYPLSYLLLQWIYSLYLRIRIRIYIYLLHFHESTHAGPLICNASCRRGASEQATNSDEGGRHWPFSLFHWC